MPWHIGTHESCKGFAVIKDSDGTVAGCHDSEEAAKKQLAALYASEPEARAKYDHIDFKPPSGVKTEAKRGLAWRSEFGRGGTAIGIARARDLSNGSQISPETARRMKAFFDRHQSDRNAEGWSPGEKGFPSNGRIAHALWGGDAGYAWSRKLVRQMEAADKSRSVREFLEARGFCATGKDGGIDNSCSSKGGGGSSAAGKFKTEGYVPQYKGKASFNDTKKAIDSSYGAFAKGPDKISQDSDRFTAEVNADKDSALSVAKSALERKGWSVDESGGKLKAYKKYEEGIDAHVIQIGVKSGAKGSKPTRVVLEGKVLPRLARLNKPMPASAKVARTPRKRSEDMQMIESRSLSIDDFSDDDAFPLLAIETRCEGDGQPEERWLVGYAARFGVNSLKMDDFYERIDPNAFSIVTERRGRKSPLETRALFNHDPNIILGRFPNTLRMKVDEHGLRYEIKMPESRSDIVEAIQRGDIRGSSFSFVVAPGGDEWSVEEGRSIRTVRSIASLVDVGPVTFPAYPDASVSVAKRSYHEFMMSRGAAREKAEKNAQRIASLTDFLKSRR